ncbi:MAG TPA: rhodanese-like domain-containing protein [Candidatus Binatia bacterium]|jgi:rhodanese-related sulfurtransferase
MRKEFLMLTFMPIVGLALAAMVTPAATDVATAQGGNIDQATLVEPNPKTLQVSTEELRRILADGSAIVLDTRSRAQFVAGHIPGARNIDAPPSESVAAVERLVSGDKSKPLVLYCNGPFCQASRQLGEQLVSAGFANVRRYQLGIPIWRALGGPTEIELEGILRIFKVDQTAVFFDARSAEEFSKGSLPGTHNVPTDKLASGGLSKAAAGLLPTKDFNTRIVLFGRDFAQARALADAFSKSPWHNVNYFPGTFETLRAAIK